MRKPFIPADIRHGKLPNLPGEFPFMCGNCGERFASKSAKRNHKADCGGNVTNFDHGQDEYCPDQHLYARSHVTPAIKARADAEWAVMDWRGRLPEGWTYEGEMRRG